MSVHEEVCSLLKKLERIIKEKPDEVTASGLVEFHVLRAMELAGCTPEKPTVDEVEAFKRGVIVE